jgi:hypothetical protein
MGDSSEFELGGFALGSTFEVVLEPEPAADAAVESSGSVLAEAGASWFGSVIC